MISESQLRKFENLIKAREEQSFILVGREQLKLLVDEIRTLKGQAKSSFESLDGSSSELS